MNSSPTQPSTRQDRQSRSDHPRRAAASKALGWLALVAAAVFPFPWWW